ncbi:hypothetical protein QYE76_017889 [Lolium multiflorum]|uniref:Reverse transcriptase Ty1/copia-type domain-containing protein n=1 Tax=Lolium multiflorum TaxID=4521 RepID=A0AAD8QM93_LOLMU|nr:hypothetical protein QYE76_017889 [Lolium multiflorum]
MRVLRLWGVLTGEFSCPPHPTAPVPPTPPSVPQALAEDAMQADRDAAKSAETAADEAYDEQVLAYSEALNSYRDSLATFTQWCDENARAAAVLSQSVQPQFASEFMGLATVAEMWSHLQCGDLAPLDTLRTIVVLAVLPDGAFRYGLRRIHEFCLDVPSLSLVVLGCLLEAVFLSRRTLTLEPWLGLALGAVTPRDFGSLTGFMFLLPPLHRPLHACLVLPPPPPFSIGTIVLVIFVVLACHLYFVEVSWGLSQEMSRFRVVRVVGLLAMVEEIAALERTDTWDVVTPPSSVRSITCKWVYKIKTRSDGSLERYKARLVARDFQQEHGRDYDETFAPVAHMTTVLTFLAVASVRHWSVDTSQTYP